MPTSLADLTLVTATLGAGLIAGLCFTFASVVMTALDGLGAPAALRAMQSINAVILRSVAMPVWIGTALVAVVATVLAEERLAVGTPAALYLLGALAVTRAGNIPLNEALDRVDPEAPDAVRAWADYRRRWGRWNTLRTVLCGLACAGFALAR